LIFRSFVTISVVRHLTLASDFSSDEIGREGKGKKGKKQHLLSYISYKFSPELNIRSGHKNLESLNQKPILDNDKETTHTMIARCNIRPQDKNLTTEARKAGTSPHQIQLTEAADSC
jgi:hypothetical protein